MDSAAATFLLAGWLAGAPASPAPSATATAAGAAGAAAARTVELFVKGDGGTYEIGVHPDMVTVLYLPEAVIKVFASDQRRFELHPIAATIAVRPRPGEPGAHGTVSVDTASLHLALVMKLVPFEDAKAQVFFRRSDQVVVDAECQTRLAAKEREIDGIKTGLAGQVEGRAADSVARAVAVGVTSARPRGTTINRNGAGIVLWIDAVARVGDEIWLRVGLENRSRTPFQIGPADIATAGAAPTPAIASWLSTELAFGERTRGALRVPRGPDGRVPSLVTVRVHEPKLGRDVSLAGLRVEVD